MAMHRNQYEVFRTTIAIRKSDKAKLEGLRRPRESNGPEPMYDVIKRLLDTKEQLLNDLEDERLMKEFYKRKYEELQADRQYRFFPKGDIPN